MRENSKLCQSYGINKYFSSAYFPQGNRLAEASNKVILEGLKKVLKDAKGIWVLELPFVLWAFRTTLVGQ